MSIPQRRSPLLAATLLVLLLILSLWGWRNSRAPSLEKRINQVFYQAWAERIATDANTFNMKYPVTPDGTSETLECVRAFVRFKRWDDTALPHDQSAARAATNDAEYFWDQVAGFIFIEGKLEYGAVSQSFEADRPALDRTMQLWRARKRTKPGELFMGWPLNPQASPPVDTETRALGNVDPIESRIWTTERVRAQAVVPALMRESFDAGNVHEGWERLCAMVYMNHAIALASRRIVDEMVAIAVEGTFHSAAFAALRAVPLDRASAADIAETFDAGRTAKEFERGVEAEFVINRETLESLAGWRTRRPYDFAPGAAGRKSSPAQNATPGGSAEESRAFRAALALRITALGEEGARQAVGEAVAICQEVEVEELQLWRGAGIEPAREANTGSRIKALAEHNPIASWLLPGTWRAARIAKQNMTVSEILRAIALLRIEELDSGGDHPPMPQSLGDVFRKHSYPLPRDWTSTTKTLIGYEPDPELGVIKLTHGRVHDEETSASFCLWGTPTLEGTAGEYRAPVDQDTTHVLTLRVASGREVPLVFNESMAKHYGLPNSMPPGTRVRIRKRPIVINGEPAFVIGTTEDLAIE